MKEFIDKLIEILEEDIRIGRKSFEVVVEIVNELAEEFGTDINVGSNGWIPCERELPKEYDYVYATCVSLFDDREPWVIEGYYSGLIGFDAMSSMLSYGEAKVVAWMPHKLPAHYTEGE